MPKIKSSLFTEDGKLISPSAGTDEQVAAKKTQVEKELEELRSAGKKETIFNEDGMLGVEKVREKVETPEPVAVEVEVNEEGGMMAEDLGTLINERLTLLESQSANEPDPVEKERLELQIWYLGEQKDQLETMTADEREQLTQMLLEEKKAAAAEPTNDVTSEPKESVPEEKPVVAPVEPPVEKAVPAPPPAPAPKTPPPAARAPPQSVAHPSPPPAAAVPAPPPAAVAPVLPPPAAESNADGSEDGVPSVQFEVTRVPRSGSFGNLDDLDALLTGSDIGPVEEDVLEWSSGTPHHLSDWLIVVENEQERIHTTYYVHKLILSTGPTKSEHFERRFLKPLEQHTSNVTLSRSAANAMPQLLDFMYSRTDDLTLTTVNSVGLRHLGKMWGIRKLVVLSTTFIRDTLKPHRGLHYLNAAAEFQDEVVMNNAATVIANNILNVDREGLTDLDPPLFSKVVSCNKIACSSEELSKIVSEFCRKHEDVIDASLLQVVTHRKNMPRVDHGESVYLLSLSEKHESTAPTQSDLEQRCIFSASNAWCGTLVRQLKVPETSLGPYDKLSAELKVKLLEDALIQAKSDYQTVDSKKEEELDQERERMRSDHKTKEASMANLRNSHDHLESSFSLLQKEFKRFKRVPVDYKFPQKKSAYTYHPFGGKYGSFKAESYPLNSPDEDQAGYLFNDGRGLWPMYYYKGD